MLCLLLHFLYFFHNRSKTQSSVRFHDIIKLYAVKEISSAEEFEKITSLSSHSKPIIIDFQKSQCKPCIKSAPLFESLSNKYNEEADFYKVDGDFSPEALALIKQNGVRSVPTFHLWNRGKRVDTIQGAHLDEVEEALQSELRINTLNNS